MGFFSKNELVAVSLIVIVVGLVSAGNYSTALRRARDMQRKNDIRLVSDLANLYQAEYGFYPPSDDIGRMRACFGADELAEYRQDPQNIGNDGKFARERFFNFLHGCDWGADALPEPAVGGGKNYIDLLPQDPKADEGLAYRFISNGDFYQIYTHLEGGSSEAEYNEGIVSRNLMCGFRICSFGISNGNTPLDKSIEEYQNELLQQKLQKGEGG
jgi:hypothetical protein